MSHLHLVSWNVNGIRAIIKKDFIKDIKMMNPDILCLQETKAQPEDARTVFEMFPEYFAYVNSSKARKGYSGTAILTRQKPLEITYDMGMEEHDLEGRVITAEFEKFYLITVYTPNSGEGMKRLHYRALWDTAFREHVVALEEKKPVIICGDLNVAHTELDIARAKANYNKTSGFTQTEIDGIENLLNSGYIDSFRHLHPDEVKYTWWNYKFRARERDVGWRIDYFLISEQLKTNLKKAYIYGDCHGSDHCPVAVDLDID